MQRCLSTSTYINYVFSLKQDMRNISIYLFFLFLYTYLSVKQTGVSRVEYKKIRDGDLRVTLTGLPEGEIFRRPCEYSTKALHSIVEAAADLRMDGK